MLPFLCILELSGAQRTGPSTQLFTGTLAVGIFAHSHLGYLLGATESREIEHCSQTCCSGHTKGCWRCDSNA